ncbi:helix-turn-helix transcriptional regulator [Vagococcus acidifermentans]|uniref:HTH cro/C1-type domain-containing protein n=1 Tax=Vagococcus acidifermentans TaxID=564710 RepID=A0A430AZG5_9ENTE|nr:hypothetical protein CBF27_04550 [Vagococcus acidifermentans]
MKKTIINHVTSLLFTRKDLIKLISDNLKKLRTKHNYSQCDIAEFLKVSRQTVSRWENSKNIPDGNNLIEICKLYNISIEDIYKK